MKPRNDLYRYDGRLFDFDHNMASTLRQFFHLLSGFIEALPR